MSRQRVVVFTWEPGTGEAFCVLDYFPSVLVLDVPRFPPTGRLAEELGGAVDVLPVPIPRDCADGFLGAWWARPQAYLDAQGRAGISGFKQIEPEDVERGSPIWRRISLQAPGRRASAR